MPSSVCSRIFGFLAFFPLLPLTVILVLQVLFSLHARELWFPDEARYADILQNLLQQGKAIVLEMNGAAYAGTPPLYFWFLRGLHAVLRTDGPMLFFTGTAISALLYLWASLGLGRFACRVDGRTNLAAGIILLSSVCFTGLVHAVGVDLLFASLVLCSHIALYRAFVNPRNATGGMVIAFVSAGLAVLVNGPPGLALPVGSIVLFALWRGNADQARCILISTAALAFGLLPTLCGLPLLQTFGLLPEAGTLPQAWALCFLILPLLALLALLKFAPSLRVCAILSPVLMIAAFAFSGGIPELRQPFSYVLPAALAALFLLWQATPQRLFRADFFLGLVAGLLTVGLWLGAVYLETGNSDFLLGPLLQQQVLDRIAGDPIPDSRSFLLLRLPLLLLPWTLLILCLPWSRLLGRQMREGLAASRRPEKEGLAFLWCMLIASLAIMSCTGDKSPQHLLPALPVLALLAGRAALALEGGRAVAFRLGMAALLFLGGIATVLVGLMFFDILPSPDFLGIHWTMPSHGGFFVAGAILLVAAALLWLGLGSSRPEGTLLTLALAAACLGYPLGSLVAPSFDSALSPKEQSLMLRAYVEKGYQPASFHVPDGLYSYYSGHRIAELKSLEDALPLAARSKFILALPASDLESWKNKPECLTEVHAQLLDRTRFLLLACPPIPDLQPAAVPYAPAPDIFTEIQKLLGITPGSAKSASDTEPKTSPPKAAPALAPALPATDSPAPAEPAVPDGPPEENPVAPDSAPPAAGQENRAEPPLPPALPAALPATDSPVPAEPAAPDVPPEENPVAPDSAPPAAGQENRTEPEANAGEALINWGSAPKPAGGNNFPRTPSFATR
jgi:4-amino-4-deoxy-L-arabinose transferase-like glycosyltransferase